MKEKKRREKEAVAGAVAVKGAETKEIKRETLKIIQIDSLLQINIEI